MTLRSIRWIQLLWLASCGAPGALLREVRVRCIAGAQAARGDMAGSGRTRVLRPHDQLRPYPGIVPDHGVSITL